MRFDHYPDIHCDEQGGAEHNDRLIRRMLAEGHQITNHGYRHIIFGKKPFVYGAREYLPGFDAAVEDLGRLHALMQTRYGYTMTLARPPHYVDKMTGGFTSYDVYDRMGYQYMAASFDGAGWLPSTDPDPEAALQAEIRAMVEPMRKALEKDPDFFCGQIIFQKDGYNMAKRTPVAFALGQQLALLQEYGYQVVPVGELLAESPFADVGREEPLFDRLTALAEQRAIVFSDNRLRLDDPMTVGELAMLLTPKADAIARRVAQLRRTGRAGAYDGAMAARQITVYAAPSDSAASLRTLRQGKVARLNDVTEDGSWYQITFSGTTGYVRADGCQTVQYSDYAGTSAVKSAREDLVDYAKSFLGTRYVWGGASPSGFDCSGFTMYVYAHFGYRMSHGASDQLYAFTRVSTAQRLAGDLVFFSYGGGDISHVGIYLGGGAFIHATSNGGVKISYFDGYYSSTYVGAVRILAD